MGELGQKLSEFVNVFCVIHAKKGTPSYIVDKKKLDSRAFA
jgi:hypothetical protein